MNKVPTNILAKAAATTTTTTTTTTRGNGLFPHRVSKKEHSLFLWISKNEEKFGDGVLIGLSFHRTSLFGLHQRSPKRYRIFHIRGAANVLEEHGSYLGVSTISITFYIIANKGTLIA